MSKTVLATWLYLYLNESDMALPDWFTEAVALESSEGKAMEAKIAELEAAQAVDKQLIADLKPLAESVPALQAKIAELEANQIPKEEALAALKEINKAPVGGALVGDVIANPEIPTPEIVAQAPEVSPNVVQDVAVVEAAAEALDDYLESIS